MKTKLNQLPAIKLTYKNILKELINNKVIYVNSNDYFKLDDEKGLLISRGDDPLNWRLSTIPLEYVLKNANGAIYEEIEVDWYHDDELKRGVLCEVWDDVDIDEDLECPTFTKYSMKIELIVKYDPSIDYSFRSITGSMYQRARPLLLDEVKDFIYEKNC